VRRPKVKTALLASYDALYGERYRRYEAKPNPRTLAAVMRAVPDLSSMASVPASGPDLFFGGPHLCSCCPYPLTVEDGGLSHWSGAKQ
jgi:hypothetical protein